MKLVRWSPLEEMSILRDQIDRIFEPLTTNGDDRMLSHTLPVEVTETPSSYFVRALVPGVDPDRIQLQATRKELVVTAEISPRELKKDETVHLNQFRYGKFSRQLTFPEDIDNEKVQARYEFGILEITLPKAESCQRKAIEIQVKKR